MPGNPHRRRALAALLLGPFLLLACRAGDAAVEPPAGQFSPTAWATPAPASAPSPSPTPGSSFAPSPAPPATSLPATLAPDPVESLLRSLSVEEKAGQLLMAAFEGDDPADARPAIAELRVGGIMLLENARTASAARKLVAGLQAVARQSGVLPLLISVDQEGGRVQRIRSGVTTFGPSWELGQLPPEEGARAACQRGATQGRELASLGIQMNLAPVLDLRDNPTSTVIGDRAFGDDPERVARLGAAYVRGLQSQGVLAVGKHFPGHGSSAEDSHQTLPVVRHDRARLESHELAPFRAAIAAQVTGIMVGHVSYPQVDPVADRPASLSPTIISGLLREQLGYDGLVLSDDLGAMKAVAGRYEDGDLAVRAIEAGADLLIVVAPPERQRRMVEALATAVGGRISPERLDASVRRVLRAKQLAGLLGPDQPSVASRSPGCPP